ncbi:MAG: glycoside hydrolase family 2 [Spirochaetes bacterium]|nr:glycoside hydrolase family 2 [Spirochaetota bacterium]
MQCISLDSTWSLTWFPEGSRAASGPTGLDGAGETVEARVPGNVELDLMRASRLPDVFAGTNIWKLRGLERNEWWYERCFTPPAGFGSRRLELLFHGLDCVAEVWLNGERVGRADNMLVEHAFDVTGRLRLGGENRLSVRLASPLLAARSFDYPASAASLETNHESLFIRKAPHMWGWDIAPRAVSAGIWRSVELRSWGEVEIVDLAFHTREIDSADATLGLHWQIDVGTAPLEDMKLRIMGRPADGSPGGFEHEEAVRFTAGDSTIRVSGARLWWPRGYGDPAMYHVRCELVSGGRTLASRTERIGIRTVELERTDLATAEGGEFLFRVNGVRVFCKGSNWVPLDAFHSRDASRCERALELFDDLGCTIIRCWGGNVYEDHAFFEHGDARGMMVWQDFAFACAVYPQDEAFLARVRAEATAVVRKLRNHPSLVLWNGDNEVDQFYLHLGRDPAANRISREVLPAVCAEHDPCRPYLPSSPYASPEAVQRYLATFRPGEDRGVRTVPQERESASRLMPEQHLWGPRENFKSSFYAESTAHFASEIGYHGCPNVSSLERFLTPGGLWPWQDNDEWRAHAADPVPEGGRYRYRIKLMADQIRELFGSVPEELENFVIASQISQAEAKKYFIESFRMRKWRRTGIIWWNVMDCWPQFSDAVVDWYFGKKLAYWYIRRSQLPVCIAVDEPENWQCGVVACNDTLAAAEGTCTVTDADSGETLHSGPFRSPPNSSVRIGRIRASHGDHRLLLVTWETAGGRGGNHYCLGKLPLDLAWYRRHLESIASLEPRFDAGSVGK